MAESRELRYDAFMAYSRSADSALAEQVARGLETFAKPWYRRRAFRVFRDVTSLSASLSLWSALEQALLSSRYLVVLLSPGSAASQWVDREISAFLRHRGADKLLLVLTGGELVWNVSDNDFDRKRSTAVPPALHGAFAAEPMWLDLRWAGQQSEVTMRDPRLQDGVAQLVAAIAGVTKDELVGEDIRQVRRTRMLERAVALGISLLLAYSIDLALELTRAGWKVASLSGIGQLALWVLVGTGAVLVLAALIRLARRIRGRSPSDTQPPAERLPSVILRLRRLRDRLRGHREIDLYIGPGTAADHELAHEIAAVVRRLGHSRRLWWRRPRVVVETRTADDVGNLKASHQVALRARHYLHLGSPETAAAPASNFILQEWLDVHPPERLLLGIIRPSESPDGSVTPAVVRAVGIDLSGRTFDLRTGFGPPKAGPWSLQGRDVPEPARLIGVLFGVDPYLVTHGRPAVLQAARRRSRIEEPLERWNLAETVRFGEQVRISVNLPEMQSAIAALGQSPTAYWRDALVDEQHLIMHEVVPRAAALLARAERNAARETWIRVGRPRVRGTVAILAVPAATLAVLLGMLGVFGFLPGGRHGLFLLGATILTGLGAVALAAALIADRRSSEFEVRQQRTFMSSYAEAVAAAAESLTESLPEAVILPYLRKRLNDELGAAGTVTIPYDATALTSQTLDRFRLETVALRRTAARIEAPGGGAIGLAGPRGAGKTTLLSSLARTKLFHRPESPESQIGVLVPAPVRYETAEFVTQVLAAVCRETIRAANRGQRLAPHGYHLAARPTRRRLAAVLFVAALVAIPFAADWIKIDERGLLLILLIGTAVAAAAVLADTLGPVRRLHRRSRYTTGLATGNAIARSSAARIRDLVATAGTILNSLYFREERALTAAVKLAVPLGIEANSSGKYEGRPWKTAEIIQQFRQFVGALNDCGYRVVIAVDELDKVDDDQEVIRLLNDLKALFGLEDCYFLVAVSISAMVRFQQRGLPFQDAFESALDEVIYVEPLIAAETVELLQRRLTGLPAPAALVCHMLGAGLPRDIIRALRNLAAGGPPPGALRTLILDDLNARLAAARTRAQLEGQEISEPVRRLLDLAQMPFDVLKWSAALDPLLDEARLRLQPGAEKAAVGPENRENDRLLLYTVWTVAAADFVDLLTVSPGGDADFRLHLAQDMAACRRLLAVDLRDAYQNLGEIRAALAAVAH